MAIRGASGSGKSALALQLIGMGASLVADDQVDIAADLTLSAPPAIAGLIEARGIGVLRAPCVTAPLQLVVDLQSCDARLPPFRHIDVLGCEIPLIRAPLSGHLAAAIRLHLLNGRQA